MQGKRIGFCSIIVSGLLLASCATTPPPPAGETLPTITLQDTSGKWYEIASIPKYYNNCHCSYAEYQPEEKLIKSTNYCRKNSANGPLQSSDVLFYPVKGSHNSRFVVKFNWLFSGDFWIVYADRASNTAVIATPDKKHFWIIARTPSIAPEQYQKMLDFLQQKGYPTAKVKMTDQSCWVPNARR